MSAIGLAVLLGLCAGAQAQVNSGSNGSDGAFNPTTSTNINMASHPDGIYQYTSVNIPYGVTVSFTPNSNNTAVIWLVQSNCVISGRIDVSGQNGSSQYGGLGGPGGYRGGNGGIFSGSAGQGPGGGMLGGYAFSASYGDRATQCSGQPTNGLGAIYGNTYILPLSGGSGGGGTTNAAYGGGGGGGAILIAAQSISLQSPGLNSAIFARGGNAGSGCSTDPNPSGAGSGGAIRLVATTLTSSGFLLDTGGGCAGYYGCGQGGHGRIRLDVFDNHFAGSTNGVFSSGFQPIIIPPTNLAVSLTIASVGGAPVTASPSGLLNTPDVIIPGQQANPVSIVVSCTNIPLNTQIIVDVKPANGPMITALGVNSVGTQASSTATILVNIPRGGGTIQAMAVSGIVSMLGASLNNGEKYRSYAQTGLTTDGERFKFVEVKATLGHESLPISPSPGKGIRSLHVSFRSSELRRHETSHFQSPVRSWADR